MKKILLFLFAFLACAYSAQAQDYVYLVGTPSGWTEPSSSNAAKYDSWKLEKSGDVYVGTFTIDAKAEFRFYSGLNGWNSNSWGPDVDHQVSGKDDATKAQRYISTDGTQYVMNSGWQDSWGIAEAGTYTFTVDLTNKKLSVTAQGSTPTPTYTDLWLRGDMNGWGTEDAYLFKTTDGVTYTLSVDGATVKGKKWQIADKNWSHKYGATDAISAVGTYNLESGYDINAGFSSELPDDTYDLEYNYSTHVLIVTAQGSTPTPTYPDLWVRGGMGETNWGATEGYKMKCTDGVYTLENVALSNTEFKIGTDETGEGVDWTYGFGAASDASAEVNPDGTEYTLYSVNNKNLSIGQVDGTVDITFTPDFNAGKGSLIITLHDTPVVGYKVYVVRPEGTEEIPNIYCYGDFSNGSWPGAAMSRAENDLVLTEGERPIYVYTVTSACKVIVNTGADGKGPWRYPADQQPGIDITEDTIIIFSDNSTATYEPFDPSKVSGVNDVEIFDEAPVEFYNLQGVRVDGELTPGLYIRRQGNSASKVLIR